MLFHTNGIQNRAVWNAMRIHAEFIRNAGEPVIFVVDKEHMDIAKSSFEKHTILTYKNIFEFLNIVVTHPDNKIFSPDIFSASSMSLAVLLKRKKVYYWVQGAVPEESYMRHESKIRKKILSSVEYIGLKFSSYQILVSTYMKEFLGEKYRMNFNSIIVPCTSDLQYMESKKEKDSYVYVGGLSAWQKFDQILLMFNKIIEENKNAKLYIATGETQQARRLFVEYLTKEAQGHVTLQNIETREEMSDFLNTKEYGFLIREDDIVNNVASPIKLAEYLSTGVNVIISSALTSYAQEVENAGAGIMVENVEDIKKLKDFSSSVTNALKLYDKTFSEENLVKDYQSIL
ncbi:MAG: hypothetical protein L3J43_02555 [Sulfurovum sp.]|nr:hypothetical protein [Sulfurovum sp.]